MERARSVIASLLIACVALLSLAVVPGLGLPQRFAEAVPGRQETTASNCRDLDRSYIDFTVETNANGASEPGRVLSVNDGTLAVLLVTSGVDGEGAVTALDFAASVRVNAIILRAGKITDVRAFDPPVRSGAGIGIEEGRPLDAISFCYRVSILPPPKAATATPASTGEQTAVPTVVPTSTQLTLDVSGLQTAEARSVEIGATATAAAELAVGELASAQALVIEIAATATAAAELDAQQASELAATIAAQQQVITDAETAARIAQATAEALQATISAPTSTPEPEPTPAPATVVTSLVYATSGDTPFADWQLVDGWDLGGVTARSDGTGSGGWVIVPVPGGLAVDAIVELEFRVTGGERCPRNFGAGIRGSATGFYAAGIEWACQPGLVVWAGSDVIASGTEPLPDPGDTWHTLRMSAVGNEIATSVDGLLLSTVTNDLYAAGNLVAFWTDGVGIEIRRVQVWQVSS